MGYKLKFGVRSDGWFRLSKFLSVSTDLQNLKMYLSDKMRANVPALGKQMCQIPYTFLAKVLWNYNCL